MILMGGNMNKIDTSKIVISDKISKDDQKSNELLVQLIYDNLLSFFFSNNDKDKEKFTKLFNNNLDKIDIKHTKKVCLGKEKCLGYFTIDNNKMKIVFGGINNYSNTSLKKVFDNATHEMMHACTANNINYLGNLNCEYHNKKISYFLDNAGIIHFESKKYNSSNEALYELTNEFLSCLVSDKILLNKKETFDKLLTTNFTKKELMNSGYMELIPVVRLLSAAFNNDSESMKHKIVGKNTLLTRFIVMKDGQIFPANNYIYNMVTNPIDVAKEYDFFMGNGAYAKLAIVANKLLNEDYKDSNIAIKNVMFELALLNRKRNAYMLDKDIIDASQLFDLENTFNDTFIKVQKNYDISLNIDNIKEFKKSCDKIDNTNDLRKIKIKRMSK